MFIPDPDFYSSRIPDPTRAINEEGGKIYCLILICATYFIERNLSKLTRIIVLFTPQKYGLGIRDPEGNHS
jgi:hypothetical protein